MHLNREKGATFIELIVVVILIAIVAAYASPSFQAMMQKYRVESGQSDLTKVLKEAKRMARMESTTVTVTLANFVNDPSTITLTSSAGANDVTTLAEGVSFGAPVAVTFSAIGTTAPPADGFFRITVSHDDVPALQRFVDVYASGQTVSHLPSFDPM